MIFADQEDDLTVGAVVKTACCQCIGAGRANTVREHQTWLRIAGNSLQNCAQNDLPHALCMAAVATWRVVGATQGLFLGLGQALIWCQAAGPRHSTTREHQTWLQIAGNLQKICARNGLPHALCLASVATYTGAEA